MRLQIIKLREYRLGDYKAHFITKGPYGPPAKEVLDQSLLFNVNEDPSERFNIASKHLDVLEKINVLVKAHEAKLVKMED